MKTRRHAKILELFKEFDIDTQDELLRYLRENGFDVTQATVSRDIKELRLVKTLSRTGKYKYSTGTDNANDMSSKFYSLFSDSVLSVGCSKFDCRQVYDRDGAGGMRFYGCNVLAGICGYPGGRGYYFYRLPQ